MMLFVSMVVGLSLWVGPPTELCDSNSGEFELMFRQTVRTNRSTSSADWNWHSYNSDNNSRSQYSCLDQLHLYRLEGSAKFVFRLAWPSPDYHVPTSIIWSQTSNPIETEVVTGFDLVENISKSAQIPFTGLALSNSRFAFLDGNSRQPWWYYAIGVTQYFLGVLGNQGIPAFDRVAATSVELHVLKCHPPTTSPTTTPTSSPSLDGVAVSPGCTLGGQSLMNLAGKIPADIIAWWPLDVSWCDARGNDHSLTSTVTEFTATLSQPPASTTGYSPNGSATGATSTSLSDPPVNFTTGLTIEGWVLGSHGGRGNKIFGWGDGAWGTPNLLVYNSYGFVFLRAGTTGDTLVMRYPRLLYDNCWHHIAVVVEPNWGNGVPVWFYVDGANVTFGATMDRSPDGSEAFGALSADTAMFGEEFEINVGTDPTQLADEVVLWNRPLSSAEVEDRATPTYGGACPSSAPTPAPVSHGRCTEPEMPLALNATLIVRVLSERLITIVTDPTAYINSEIQSRCGSRLSATEKTHGGVFPRPWQISYEYTYAAKEIIDEVRPPMLLNLSTDTGGFVVNNVALTPELHIQSHSLWPNAAREFRVQRVAAGDASEELMVTAAEVQFFSYVELATPLSSGRYRVSNAWGNTVEFTFDELTTVSWALKINQAGYPCVGPKMAYLGSWLGPAGSMNVSSWIGKSFTIRNSSDVVVFTSTIEFRANDTNADPSKEYTLTGETLLQLDFTNLTTPGEYHVQVDRLGISWSFPIGVTAVGNAFRTHIRGLFHQRCGINLTNEFTSWTRNDVHQTFRGGHPPLAEDYRDNTESGWGFMDENGSFPVFGITFDVVAAMATDEALPHVTGGWHDAGDFDRRLDHFAIVMNLVTTYLMYPSNFQDGQQTIPESSNGIPDIMDEAAWGIDVWLRAQEDDGRSNAWIEATSHPLTSDPGVDHQRYYTSMATRESTLIYCRHAALLARGYLEAGASQQAETYIESAERAFWFGVRTDIRVAFNYTTAAGLQVFWKEREVVRANHVLYAASELWLATRNTTYYDILATPTIADALQAEVNNAHWQRHQKIGLMTFAMSDPTDFPTGWKQQCFNRIVSQANEFLAHQNLNPYRKTWYSPTHKYFTLGAWGTNGWNHIRWFTSAYRLTGSEVYRSAALHGASWMHGANPQGRPYTTGIGSTRLSTLLHLPSFLRRDTEPVPGLTIFGNIGSIASGVVDMVYGLYAAARNDGYAGSQLPQLPPPWNNSTIYATADDVRALLHVKVPWWRRLHMLEAQNVPVTETVVVDSGDAVAVLGALMGVGYTHDNSLETPKTKEQLVDGWFIQP
eukprot:m.118090 g.118090  ORF g.118090 m.118090 type:complete len:1316 (+) comp28633_c0_seq1:254-4201(+)